MATLTDNCANAPPQTFDLVELLLREQQDLTAVSRFAQRHVEVEYPLLQPTYRDLIPLSQPGPGEQFAFEVDLNACSGCKACVVACHNLNGLEENETWRSVGLLQTMEEANPIVQHVTTACHHCVDPGCLSGCPVKAYEKDPVTGIVVHLDDQCIGCQYCTLMCPYDVPQYSKSKGIVRKCDMCHTRLASGEAPACVQSCPSRAIKITVVSQEETIAQADRNEFLATAADPRITKPTTRFVGHVPGTLGVSGSQNNLRPAHGHVPLVLLLVLSQVSLGSLAASLIASAWNLSAQAGMATAILSLITALAAMLVAPLHLGRPLYGFRVFLGLRTSWLSREAVLLGKYTPLVGAYLATYFLAGTSWNVVTDYCGLIGGMALSFGTAVVFCSAMIYIVTRRALWRPWRTFSQFAATTLLAVGFGLFIEAAFAGDLSIGKTFQILAVAGVVSLLLVRIGTAIGFRRLIDGELSQPLVRSAKLLRGRLVTFATWRELAWALGGGLMMLMLLGTSEAADLWIVGVFLIALCLLVAETLDRFLYFAAESTPTMPGQPK